MTHNDHSDKQIPDVQKKQEHGMHTQKGSQSKFRDPEISATDDGE